MESQVIEIPEEILEGYEQQPSGLNVALIPVGLIVLLVEILLVRWILTDGIVSYATSLAIHVFIVVLLLSWASGCKKMDKLIHYPLLLGVSTAVMGPFGAAGTLLAFVIQKFSKALSFREWFVSIFPEERMTDGTKLTEMLERYQRSFEHAGNITPFREVLLLGTVRQKQDIIGTIGRNFTPVLAPALKLALRDDANVVRIQAAAAIAKIEKEFLDEAIDLERLYKKHSGSSEMVLAMAKYYDAYAFTGLLESDYEMENRAKALTFYQKYLESHRDDRDTCLSIARLHFRNKDYKTAAQWIEDCHKKGIDSLSLTLWLMECYYYLGKHALLNSLAVKSRGSVDNNANLPKEVKQMVLFWSGAKETPEEVQV